MSNAYVYRMPGGIAGDVTRHEISKIEAQVIDPSTYPPTVFGVPVKMVTGKIERLIATGDSTSIYGFIVRPFPTMNTLNEAIGTATPSLVMACNVLVSGYMTVKVTAGTAVKNAAVYFNNSTGLIEGTSGAGNTAVPGAHFMGAADSKGNVEIAYNI